MSGSRSKQYEQNLALVRAIFDTGPVDVDQILASIDEWVPALYTDDVEFSETPERIDARTLHGHAGVKEAFTRFFEQWDKYSARLIEVEDHGDRAFVILAESAIGKGSGAPVEKTLFIVVDIRESKICRYQEFYDETAAREALSESPHLD